MKRISRVLTIAVWAVLIYILFQGILLTLISIVLSESMVYITSRILVTSNMTMVILYGFLGNSFLSPGKNAIITAGIIIIISISSIYLWNIEQRLQRLS